MALIQKAFSDIITFSRSSNATRIGPTGLVEYAPHNLLLRSQEFDNASWTKEGCAATANSAAAPDGTVTSELIVASAGSGNHRLYQNAGTTTAGLVSTFSLYVKYSNHSWIYLRLTRAGETDEHTWFNIQTGEKGTQDAGIISALITSVGNGWYRVSITCVGRTGGDQYPVFGLASGNNNVSWTAAGTESVLLWGAQLAVGTNALDYTPTTSAAVYGPRFDYDPVTLAAKGLLVEEQRTNLCPYSEQINQWSGTTYNVTITSNSSASPDGQTTAETVTCDTTNNYHIIGHADVSFTSGSSYAFSIFVKQGTARYVQILFGSAAFALTEYANFDLQTGTVVGGDTADATIIAFANGWYRITYKGVANVSVSDRAYLAIITSASAARAEVHTQALSIYAWGAQLEAGSFATSYIPTLASSVTRSADVASVNTLSPWMNEVEGTIYGEITSLTGALALTNQSVAEIDTGSTNDRNKISRYNGIIYGSTTTGGTFQADVSLGNAASANTVYKAAYRFKANDFAGTINGGTVQTDTSGTVPSSLTKLWLGNNPNSDYLNGHLRRVAFYPRALTAAELQALTA